MRHDPEFQKAKSDRMAARQAQLEKCQRREAGRKHIINLPQSLYKLAHERATAEHRTFNSVAVQAFRLYLGSCQCCGRHE